VSIFWDNAARIMEAAVAAVATGFATSETMTVLIGHEGGMHLLPNNDWPLDRLAQERGARMAYRVSQTDDKVMVNGLQGMAKCLLEADKPESRAKALLRDRPQYFLE
jgi:adenosyl cobinamide kinase/adenosyl cobinamide phosphate guanylyltransferase